MLNRGLCVAKWKAKLNELSTLLRSYNGNLEGARDLHSRVCSEIQLLSLHPSRIQFLSNLALLMFGRCGGVEDARELFTGFQGSDQFSWNAMLKVFLDNHRWADAECLFHKFPQGAATAVSCTGMISLFSSQNRVKLAKSAFDRIPEGDLDAIAWTSMLTCYSRNGCIDQAVYCFQTMHGRDVIAWNALLAAYAHEGHLYKAEVEALVHLMPMWDSFSFNSSISSQDSVGAKELFDGIQSGKSVISFNALLAAYIQDGDTSRALKIFERMPKRNLISMTSIACAYAQDGHMRDAKLLFDDMQERDTLAWRILLHGYSRNGCVKEASLVFLKSPVWEVTMLNSILTANAVNGYVDAAVEWLRMTTLEGMQASEISFVCLLDGFSHVARVSGGRECFLGMVRDYGVEANEKHYTCMVDLLGRAGRLEEAEELMNSMPFVPDAVVAYSLVNACSIQEGSLDT